MTPDSCGTIREVDGLSRREAEVLGLVGRHMSNRQIAERLCISVRTVESHVAALIRKLPISDRRTLVGYASERARTSGGMAQQEPSTGLVVPPATHYATSEGVHIAFQVVGEGSRDILFVPGVFSHLELAWEDPGQVALYQRLARLGRLILFDKRDTGLSDPSPRDSPLEERMQDLQAVMAAVDCDNAVVVGYSEGAPMSILFAATHPEMVSALILGSGFARWFPAPDYPCGPGAQQAYEALRDIFLHRFGEGATIDWFLPSQATSLRVRQALARFERMAVSPSTALRMLDMIRHIDVRAVLPAVRVPTLVIQRAGDRINPPFYGRYLASHIPGARYFEQPGDHVLRFAEGEELDSLFAEIEDLLASATTATDHPRVLTTILCAPTLEHLLPADELDKWGGHLRESGAGRMTATFDAPGQAIRCARAICAQGAKQGLHRGAGIHTGEVYLVGNEIHGTSVEIAASVAAHARPGEVLVSRTVQDLVVGSGISFAERGYTRLKAIEGQWPLFTVTGA